MSMQKYIIAVGSEEISREAQESLFRAGFSWRYDKKAVQFTEDTFLQVNFGDRVITRESRASDNTGFIQDGAILISSQEVIENPYSLDGAMKPMKEMTVEQIGKALGHEVKIIK
jgi:hypothetical protein